MSSRRPRVLHLVVVLLVASCSIPSASLVDGNGPDGLHVNTDGSTDAQAEPALLTESPAADAAFGDVVLGQTSPAAAYTVSNDGDGPSGAIAITFDDPGHGFALASDACTGKMLAPHTSCAFGVTFAPTASGVASTTMHVVAHTGGDLTRMVSGNGLVPGDVNIVADNYDFGNLGVDAAPAKHAFDITNGGAATIGAPAATISGSTSDYFVDSTTCTQPLAPGEHCAVTIRFDPTTVGSKPGSLTVTSASGGQDAAALSGLSVATVTVVRAGSGMGSIASTQPGITCGATCVADFSSSPVTLTATPEVGTSFVGWSGDCSGAGSCSLELVGAKTVTGTFVAITPTLTVTKTGIGGGSVTSTPSGITCGAACSHNYAYNTAVTLSANPDPGSSFTGWGGACTNTTGSCMVTMDQARNVTASFDAVTPTLTVTLAGTGAGAVTSPSGINCGATCGQSYPFGTNVTLTASPTAGSGFTGWSGAGAGSCTTATTCVVTMDMVRGVTATFDVLTPKITVSKAGAGSGTVTSNPGAISCGSTCNDTYPYNTSVTLTAAAAAGSTFAGWSGTGGCTGTQVTCVLTADQDRAVTATFAVFTPQLTIVKAGSGSGTVAPSPAGTTCGAGCSTYPYNQAVTLTETPAGGSNFTGWSGGGCSGTATTCMVTMAMAQTVTATFDLQTPTLVVTVAGTGAGSVSSNPAGIACDQTSTPCQKNYTIGTPVTLTAMAAAGSMFTGWSGSGCSGTGTCMVTMDAGHGVTATFAAITPTLTITKAGTGTGTVTSNPAGIACGATCAGTFPFGQVVVLTAAATGGASFVGWTGTGSGACNGTGTTTCSLTMDQARDVTATFTAGLQTLSITEAGSGTGTVTTTSIACPGTCSASYAFNTPLTLTATATNGGTFAGWSGADSGACNGTTTTTCSVTMNQARAITATFTAGPQTLTVSTSGTGTGIVTSSPSGINCGAGNTMCMLAVPFGNVVTLSRQVVGTSTFNHWTGACSGTGTCSVTMNVALSVGAVFDAGSQPLAIAVTGTGAANGSVSSSPAGINCGAGCSASFAYNTSVTLTAVTTGTATFASWSGDGGACNGSNATTCIVTMDQARNITATFNAGAQQLTVVYAGAGTGTITSNPAGLSCTVAPCSASFAYNTPVVLTAAATMGSTFSGWSGGPCTGTGTCSVTMSAAQSVTATFVAAPQTLSVQKIGSGAAGGLVASAGNVINCGATCSAAFAFGTTVVLTATPSPGDTFDGWVGACSGTGTCSVQMIQAQAVSAKFTAGLKTLTATQPSNGEIDASDSSIKCGGTCSAGYAAGSMVMLSANPAANFHFVSWGGDCAGSGTNQCTLTMSTDHAVSATFAADTYTLTVTETGSGAATSKVSSDVGGIGCQNNAGSCAGTVNYGTKVTLTETPGTDTQFAGWSGGGCAGLATTCTTTVTAATAVTATFLAYYKVTLAPSDNSTFGFDIPWTGMGTVEPSFPQLACGGGGGMCATQILDGTVLTIQGNWMNIGSGTNTCKVASIAWTNCVHMGGCTPTMSGTNAACEKCTTTITRPTDITVTYKDTNTTLCRE